MRKILLTGLGMAVAGALTLSGNMTGLAASAQPSRWFTVGGTVTGVSGPVHLWLYAWPSAAIVRSLRPGQRVPLKVLGEQTTSTGQYALSVNPATLPGGIVNMEVAAFGGGAMTARSFTRWRVAAAGTTVLAMPFGPARMAPQVANMRLRPAAPDSPCGAVVFGSLVFKRNVGKKWVVVGGTFSRVANITANFAYVNGQRSSLGVGLSADATFKKFHQSGEFGISQDSESQSQSQSGSIFPAFHGVGSQDHRTMFRYGLYRWFCTGPRGGGGWANWQTQVTDSAGGTSSPRASSAFRTPYCVPYQAGSKFTLDTTSAYTFGQGVSISDFIGINLSSQTGYDTRAELSYKVTGKNGRLICGKNNNPGGVHPPPQLVVAGQQ